jgi:hypothetical protein
VQAIEKRFGGGHYSGPLRLYQSEFSVGYGTGRVIFVEHCNDLFAEDVPREWIRRILNHCCEYPENTYVFQTKNPERMLDCIVTGVFPPNRILGCTMETSCDGLIEEISSAPNITDRWSAMYEISIVHGERTFITVEPVLKSDMICLAEDIKSIEPDFVNIGADSKGGSLPEPSPDEIRTLVASLNDAGIEIREKRNLDRLLNGSIQEAN